MGLLDSTGNLVKKFLTPINPKTWQPEQAKKETVNIKVENLAIGQYQLAVGLFKAETDETPTYLLGSEGKTQNNWYVFGQINLTK